MKKIFISDQMDRYGHPHAEVIDIWQDVNSEVLVLPKQERL
ncbi:hypothetical protein MHH37_17845 [Solibacillus sp. FSL K6-1781]